MIQFSSGFSLPELIPSLNCMDNSNEKPEGCTSNSQHHGVGMSPRSLTIVLFNIGFYNSNTISLF